MRKSPFAAAAAALLAALLAGSSQAGEVSFSSKPVNIAVGMRLAMGLTNSCYAPTDYRVRVLSAGGATLMTQNGQMPSRGEAVFAYTPEKAIRGVVITVRLSCPGATPKKWLSFMLQKAVGPVTKPRPIDLRGPLVPPGKL
jgi:hypothetical protein